MFNARIQRLHAASLALLAALALAVLPAVSRAMPSATTPPTWSDICRSSDTPDLHHALAACGHCVVAGAPLLPTSLAPTGQVDADKVDASQVRSAGLPSGPVRAAAAARAPPVGA